MNVSRALRPVGAGARLGRVRGAGQTGLIFVAAASVTDRFATADLVSLYLLALCGHAIGNVVNDVADLGFDRLHRDRSLRPLVNDDMSVTGAVCLALCLLVGLGISLSLGNWHRLGAGLALVMMFALVWGNTYQKRVGPRGAIWMDVLFGVGMASPLLICSALVGTVPANTAIGLFVCFAAEMMLLNAVAGNLKDLADDERVAVSTTALALGVTGSRLAQGDYPRIYVFYCRGLQACMWGAALAALAVAGRPVVELVVAAATLVVLCIIDGLSVNRLLSGRRPFRAGGSEPYTGLELAGFLVVAGVSGRLTWVAVAVGAAAVTYGLGLLLESLGAPSRILRAST